MQTTPTAVRALPPTSTPLPPLPPLTPLEVAQAEERWRARRGFAMRSVSVVVVAAAVVFAIALLDRILDPDCHCGNGCSQSTHPRENRAWFR